MIKCYYEKWKISLLLLFLGLGSFEKARMYAKCAFVHKSDAESSRRLRRVDKIYFTIFN